MNAKGFLLIVRGLPGCGKTTVIDEIMKLWEFSEAIRLNPDEINVYSVEFLSFCETFNLRSPNLPLKKKIYRYLLRIACQKLINRKIVIWEQPWRSKECLLTTIENIGIIAYGMNNPLNFSKLPFSIGIVEISINKNEAQKRIEIRFQKEKHSLAPKDFIEFIDAIEPFDDIGFPFIRIDGTKQKSELAIEIKKFIIKEK